jgi:hypothetical protein
MSILLDIVLAVIVSTFAASQFRYRGYAIADLTCENAFGMCDKPLWLGVAAAVLFAATVVARNLK